ncbi:MAG: type II toxin-antitoxin system RelE/ParE family toxin [Rubrobacter sp.]|jgi:mRNA-degrading endonuclease RelE of RelBE toxin-antitoxin system|nr:type II toxin-antitoxin system RelE/ParE family toxin [Rubrobacter sp.]
MFGIEFTPEALEDLRLLRAYDQRRIIESVEEQLRHQPTQETRNRKRLRPNELAEWELRIGGFRVFYDADEENALVKIEAVEYKPELPPIGIGWRTPG